MKNEKQNISKSLGNVVVLFFWQAGSKNIIHPGMYSIHSTVKSTFETICNYNSFTKLLVVSQRKNNESRHKMSERTYMKHTSVIRDFLDHLQWLAN